MIADRIEGKWVDLFAQVFELCKVAKGDVCALLSETQSRELNVRLAELALERLGARPFHVVLPTPRQTAPVPIRSTGANEVAGRYTLGHYDLPFRRCTIALDGETVVEDGKLRGELA